MRGRSGDDAAWFVRSLLPRLSLAPETLFLSLSLSREVARVFGEVGCAFYEDDDEGGRRVR